MKLLGILLLITATVIGSWLLEAMWLMLAVGDMHRNWWPAVPLMGWGASLGITFCLTAFLAAGTGVAGAAASRDRRR